MVHTSKAAGAVMPRGPLYTKGVVYAMEIANGVPIVSHTAYNLSKAGMVIVLSYTVILIANYECSCT